MCRMQRRNIDLWAGLLVIMGIISLVFIALRAANISNIDTSEAYRVQVSFENIGGIKVRSPVKSSGVLVGRVESVILDTELYEAVVGVAIQDSFQFPDDSSFSVVSTNLLGDQYIHVTAGGSEDMLADGDEVIGNSAIILEELIGKFLFDQAEEG